MCPCIVSIIVNDDQQDATILAYLFIPNQLYMFRAMSSPIIRSTWLYLQDLILSTGIAVGWCHGWDGTLFLKLHNHLALHIVKPSIPINNISSDYCISLNLPDKYTISCPHFHRRHYFPQNFLHSFNKIPSAWRKNPAHNKIKWKYIYHAEITCNNTLHAACVFLRYNYPH